MVNELPKVNYNGVDYYVDFRLGELRRCDTAQQLKFTDIKEGKYSPIKKELRAIRGRYWHHDYVKGIDD